MLNIRPLSVSFGEQDGVAWIGERLRSEAALDLVDGGGEFCETAFEVG